MMFLHALQFIDIKSDTNLLCAVLTRSQYDWLLAVTHLKSNSHFLFSLLMPIHKDSLQSETDAH